MMQTAHNIFHVEANWSLRIPFDLRILRILLPAQYKVSISRLLNSPFARFLTSHNLHLGNTMAVSQDDTDLGRSRTLSGKFADVVNHGFGGALEPGRHRSRVRDGRGADTLSFAVKTTHGCGLSVVERSVVDEIAVLETGCDLELQMRSLSVCQDWQPKKSWRRREILRTRGVEPLVSPNNTPITFLPSRKPPEDTLLSQTYCLTRDY